MLNMRVTYVSFKARWRRFFLPNQRTSLPPSVITPIVATTTTTNRSPHPPQPSTPSCIRLPALQLSKTVLSLLWWGVTLVAGVQITFLIAMTIVYLPTSRLVSLVESIMPSSGQVLKQNANLLPLAFLLPALPFVLVILRLVWYSLRRHRLSFGSSQATFPSKCCARIPFLTKCLDVRGPYFDHVILLREILEAMVQTMQGYRLSQFSSKRLMGPAYGIVIFLHCWSGLVAQYFGLLQTETSQRVMTERLVRVLIDQLISVLGGPVIQILLLSPYVSTVFGATASMEALAVKPRDMNAVALVSCANYVLTIYPILSSGVGLSDLQSILLDAELLLYNNSRTVPLHEEQEEENLDHLVASGSHRRDSLLVRLLKWLFCLHGLSHLLVGWFSGRHWMEIHAAIFAEDRVFPWYSIRVACIDCHIRCSSAGLLGRKTEVTNVMQYIEPSFVETLVFSDCLELEMPPQLSHYTQLGTLKVEHGTIREWGLDAQLTNVTTPALKKLWFENVDFTGVPYGLFAQPSPKKLRYVTLQDSDASSFMHLTGGAWTCMTEFQCVNCHLEHVPAAVASAHALQTLVLNDNKIDSISLPELGGSNLTLRMISLDENPLTSLPDAIWTNLCTHVTRLSIQKTQIAAIPSEFLDPIETQCCTTEQDQTVYQLVIHAYETPLCNQLITDRDFNSTANGLMIDMILCSLYEGSE